MGEQLIGAHEVHVPGLEDHALRHQGGDFVEVAGIERAGVAGDGIAGAALGLERGDPGFERHAHPSTPTKSRDRSPRMSRKVWSSAIEPSPGGMLTPKIVTPAAASDATASRVGPNSNSDPS